MVIGIQVQDALLVQPVGQITAIIAPRTTTPTGVAATEHTAELLALAVPVLQEAVVSIVMQ